VNLDVPYTCNECMVSILPSLGVERESLSGTRGVLIVDGNAETSPDTYTRRTESQVKDGDTPTAMLSSMGAQKAPSNLYAGY